MLTKRPTIAEEANVLQSSKKRLTYNIGGTFGTLASEDSF